MKLLGLLLPLAVVALAACAGTESGGSAADPSFILSSTGKDGGPTPPPVALTIRGTLTFDDIEGGCAYVESADGKRYEVVYPEGWVLDRPGARLTDPSGAVIPAGTTLEVGGTIATDRSSICQVGPIVLAATVSVVAP